MIRTLQLPHLGLWLKSLALAWQRLTERVTQKQADRSVGDEVKTSHLTLSRAHQISRMKALCGHVVDREIDAPPRWDDPRTCPTCLAIFYRLNQIDGSAPRHVQ